MATARDDYSLVDLPSTHLFQPTVDSLSRQAFGDFELVVVDGLHVQRKGFFDGAGFQVKHVPPKPSPYLERGQWAVCDFLNTALVHAEGELVVRIDDASEFSDDYLRRIWDWHTEGVYPLSLVNYYRGGKVARYDELARQHYERMTKAGPPVLEGEISRKIEMLGQMYKEGQAIEDSRLKLIEGDVMRAPWSWVYGYVSLPLRTLLDVNGYDEAFDGKKSLEDPDLGLRVALSGRDKFVIDKRLWAVENFHGPVSEKVMWSRSKPACCNYAIMRLHQEKGLVRANARKFTGEELGYIRAETVRSPCSHVNGEDYDTGEGFRAWADDVPVFDLRKLREDVEPRAALP